MNKIFASLSQLGNNTYKKWKCSSPSRVLDG
jgi:hypothetical protein